MGHSHYVLFENFGDVIHGRSLDMTNKLSDESDVEISNWQLNAVEFKIYAVSDPVGVFHVRFDSLK